jgi:hypothetical protein
LKLRRPFFFGKKEQKIAKEKEEGEDAKETRGERIGYWVPLQKLSITVKINLRVTI